MLAAIAIIVWQISELDNKREAPPREAPGLSFHTNAGGEVTLPDALQCHTVVVFWRADSERSLKLVAEAIEVIAEPPGDFEVDFYLVSLDDDLATIRSVVDYDNPDIPFGYRAQGTLLDEFDLNAVPVTIHFSRSGKIIGKHEGYQPNRLIRDLRRYALIRNLGSRSRGFHFLGE